MTRVNITSVFRSVSPKVKINAKNFKPSGKYPIVSQEASLISGYWDDENSVMHFDNPVVVYGDHTRNIKYVDFDFVVGADGIKIFNPNKDLNGKYLYYWLLANPVDNLGYARHFRLLKEKSIDLPPLEEQQHIVAKLDAAFEKIDQADCKTYQNILRSEAVFRQYRSEVFSKIVDKTVPLGKYAVIKSGGTPSKAYKEYWNGGTVDWYSSGELNDKFTKEPKAKITQLGLKNSTAKLFAKGSLLIGMYDTAAMKMSILDRDAAFNQAIAGVEPNDKLDIDYLYHILNFVKPGVLKLRVGIRQQNLNLTKIQSIGIPFPDSRVQKFIGADLDEVMKRLARVKELYQSKREKLADLKQSMLNEAFSESIIE